MVNFQLLLLVKSAGCDIEKLRSLVLLLFFRHETSEVLSRHGGCIQRANRLYDSETGAKFLCESRKSTTNPWEHMGFWPGNLNMGEFS
jgi:hypothetical protein